VSLFGLFEAKIMNSMKIGEGSSSGDEPRKIDLLHEILEENKFEEHSRKLKLFKYDDILKMSLVFLMDLFGIEFGAIYSFRIGEIRKRLNLGKNLLLSSSKTHLLSLHFFFSPYLILL